MSNNAFGQYPPPLVNHMQREAVYACFLCYYYMRDFFVHQSLAVKLWAICIGVTDESTLLCCRARGLVHRKSHYYTAQDQDQSPSLS